MKLIILLIGINLCYGVVGQCTFPANFTGTWVSNYDGTWSINGTHILGFPTVSLTTGTPIAVGLSTMDFECYENQGTQYVIRSQLFELFVGANVNIHVCLDIRQITTTKFVYYRATEIDPGGFQLTIASTFADVCNLANYDLPYSYYVALKSGSESTEMITCPPDLFGTYNYDTCTDPASTNTTMDVCDTRQQLIFNYTMCSTKQLFSLQGTLNCIYYTTSGSISYLTVYNTDSIPPDGSTYYLFTCLAVALTSGTVYMTANPQKCNDNQNTTAIDSPGAALQLSSYYLCPITTSTTAPTEDSTSIIPIIVGVIVGLLVLAAIIALIIYCCLRKRRKKKEDEESIADESSKSTSRRSSRTSSNDGDKSSLDSGISEPPITQRTDSDKDRDEDDGIQVTELIINDEGDKDVDDKTSRPGSGERSRMSDLPPSTIPPEDEPLTQRSDEEPKGDEDDQEQLKEEEDNDKKGTEEELEKSDTEKADADKEDDNKEKSDDEDKEEGETSSKHDSDEEGVRKTAGGGSPTPSEEKRRREGRRASGGASDRSTDREGKRDGSLSSDEERRQAQMIGGKKGKHFSPTGALTTVLISREDDERQKEKLKKKSKRQKLKNFAKKKLKKFGRGGKKHVDDSDNQYDSSDGEGIKRGPRGAPFMKQYEDKKHLEHILDEQHYWSDPEADKDAFGVHDNMSSVFNSDLDSDSEEEIIGPDGVPIRVKKSKYNRNRDKDEFDDISNADSEYLRMKMLKRAGSVDTLVSVEDPNDIDKRKSKRRLHEHTLNTNRSRDDDGTLKGKKDNDGTDGEYNDSGDDQDEERDADGNIITNKGKGKRHRKGKTGRKGNTILVKEHSGSSLETDDNLGKSDKELGRTTNGELFGDLSDSDIEKLSDRDSGMDDEDEEVDVTLNKDQQQMIVNMLFDEDMNLRPQFYRNEDGKIVRRLDDSVIYDPHTGRFTFKKRLGQLFKIPRLRRNNKGRPTGGFIEDEFGPKQSEILRQRSGSAPRSNSGRSGRNLTTADSTRSPSADLKRARAEGRNVGFDVPDEDTDIIPENELEFNKRGRRDTGSAVRRKLKRRLFKKKKTHGITNDGLPDVVMRNAWGEQSQMNGPFSSAPLGNINPMNTRYRHQQGSPWQQRRGQGRGDPSQWQMYREGLQSDRRILENLQDKLNSRGENPFGPREAFVEGEGEGDEYMDQNDHQASHTGDPHSCFNRGYSYMSEDGRLVIRERGCPELKQPKVPLFTIIRRPGDLEQIDEAENDQKNRPVKSAPMHLQDYNPEQGENDMPNGHNHRFVSENSLVARSNDGSQMTSIDDNRLRRLLEELYKDKKYFDNYVEKTEPKSDAIIHSKGLAEHGRGYLLERADYWERRGPLPRRPPMTAVGWKMQQQQLNSRQNSDMGSTTITCTPDMSASHMPGVVESPTEDKENETTQEQVRGKSPEESFA